MFSDIYSVLIENNGYMVILRGLGNTLLLSLAGIAIGTLLGCLLAFCKISQNWFLRGIAAVYTTIIRGIPVVTQLVIFYFVIFAPFGWDALLVAALGFGINSGAYVCEIFRSGITGVDAGQMEAGRSLGLSRRQTLIKIILPQAFKISLPAYTNEFIALIKETSVASFIAVTDLNKAGDMIRNATYEPWIPLLTVAVIYLILTVGLTKLFSILERRLARSDRG